MINFELKRNATNYRAIWSLVMVRNQLPAQVVTTFTFPTDLRGSSSIRKNCWIVSLRHYD